MLGLGKDVSGVVRISWDEVRAGTFPDRDMVVADACQGLRMLTLRCCLGTKSLSKLGSNPNNVLN